MRPVSNARMPGAPGIPRAHLASPGAPAIFTGAPGVIEVHLQSTGAPCEWQVRPVSNKRMPGAPGDLQVHLGISRSAWHRQVRLASPGAPDAYVISQGAPERQILNHWCHVREVVAEYEPPAPPICLRGALETCLGEYDYG